MESLERERREAEAAAAEAAKAAAMAAMSEDERRHALEEDTTELERLRQKEVDEEQRRRALEEDRLRQHEEQEERRSVTAEEERSSILALEEQRSKEAEAEQQKKLATMRELDLKERKAPVCTPNGLKMPDGRTVISPNGRFDLGVLKMSTFYDDVKKCITIGVFEGRSLPIMGNDGKSDSYVKMYWMPDPNKKTKSDKCRKCKTKTKKAMLNPSWDETFSMSVANGELDTHTLVVQCWHFKFGRKNDFIGRVEVEAHTIERIGTISKTDLEKRVEDMVRWYAWQPNRGTTKVGSHMVGGAIKYPDGSIRMPTGVYMLADGTEVKPMPEEPHSFMPLPNVQGAKYLEDASISMPDGSTILPSKATLRGDGTLRLVDGSLTKATFFVSQHALPSGCKQQADFSYVMHDGDHTFQIRSMEGSNVALSRGVIKLVVRYYCADGVLLVEAVQCRGLPAMDSNGFSDPYVCVFVKEATINKIFHKGRSEVLDKTLNPDFAGKAKWIFPCNRNELSKLKLEVQVWDWDAGFVDDFIGVATIALSQCPLDARSAQATDWYELQTAAEFEANNQEDLMGRIALQIEHGFH